MKHFTIFLTFFFFISISIGQNKYNVIPEPARLTQKNGTFTINKQTQIVVIGNGEALNIANLLASKLNIQVQESKEGKNKANRIYFLSSSDKTLAKEGYELKVSSTQILIEANEGRGFFNALQTLYQLFPPEIYGNKEIKKTLSIPCCEIYDYPRFAYRGMHLDVCRHFFPVSFLKKYIDLLAMHKINYFHWHLTDDQGWRIEIKQYPKLTEIGGTRKETLIGHYSDNVVQQFDGKPYSGFYTQAEIQEVVNYAQSKYITIVPEIELPGHALAALSAYSEFSCTGGPHDAACTWGVFEDVFCPKEETFVFLQNIMDEVIGLFPNSPYIHIGGDECPKVRWKSCPNCQKRIQELGLKDEYGLQSYFIGRISRYLINKGKKVIAWDEALEGGLSEDVIIMSWQGEAGGIEAAKQKHQAIMTPSSYLYLNFYQGDPSNEPPAFGGFTTLERVYNYEPVPPSLTPEEQKYIIGTQANLWTEYIDSEKLVEYMVYPRASALAEVAWSKKENRNWEKFLLKLNDQFKRFDILNVNYSKSHYNLKSKTTWNQAAGRPQIALETACKICEIRYTLDGSEPNAQSALLNKPLVINKDSLLLIAAAFSGQAKASGTFKQKYIVSKSAGKNYTLSNPNPEYTGGNPLALTDGILASETGWNKWVGIFGHDLDILLDLSEPTEIKEVKLNYLNNPASWIFLPLDTEISFSNDGKRFENAMLRDLRKSSSEERKIVSAYFNFEKPVQARYIKIHANAVKKCPEGHSGFGYNAHLFVDEVSVW